MNLVVDANILFAALIKDSMTVRLLLDDKLNLYAPEFLLEEFTKYKEAILKKTKRSYEEFDDILTILMGSVKLVPEDEYDQFMREAGGLSPDQNDAMYFALAIRLKCAVWSNDKRLKKQEVIKVHDTGDVINLVGLNT